MTLPTDDQALQFAVMLQAGLPARDAIHYFLDTDEPLEIAAALQLWQRSRAVKRAMLALMKQPWHTMTLDERIHHALTLHYSALAYYLFAHHYADLDPSGKAKADTARTALEAKLAGMAGKGDALSRFIDDLTSGRLRLPEVSRPVTNARLES